MIHSDPEFQSRHSRPSLSDREEANREMLEAAELFSQLYALEKAELASLTRKKIRIIKGLQRKIAFWQEVAYYSLGAALFAAVVLTGALLL